jgi:putative transposase
VDANRDELGVEPICAAKARPPSARARRDEELENAITRVYEENLFVYGAEKVWAQLNRQGTRVARCTVDDRTRHGMNVIHGPSQPRTEGTGIPDGSPVH